MLCVRKVAKADSKALQARHTKGYLVRGVLVYHLDRHKIPSESNEAFNVFVTGQFSKLASMDTFLLALKRC